MTDERAFLQEIAAAPDEDLPRLVFADWLEEQGDPRAELIRLQCEAARLPQEDAKRLLLEEQALQMEPVMESLWLDDQEKHVQTVQFQRGLIHKVTMTAWRFVRHAGELYSRLPIPGLELSRCSGRMEELSGCNHLQHVRSLEIQENAEWENHLVHSDIAMLARSPHLQNLERLHLRAFEIGREGAEGFRDAPALAKLKEISLDLSVRSARHRERLHFDCFVNTTSLPSLEKLRLSHAPLKRDEVQAMIRWTRFPHLTGLELIRCDLNSEDLSLLLRAEAFPRLRTLNLSQHDLKPSACQELVENRQLEELEVLNLDGCGIGDLGMSRLQQLTCRPRELHLSSDQLGDFSLLALLDSDCLDRLEVLDLSFNHFTEDGIRRFIDSAGISRLKVLNLSGCRLNSQAARILARSSALRELRHLNLSRNLIGNEGANAFARSSQFPNLAVLNLSQTHMGNAGMTALSASRRFPNLRVLHLDGNAVNFRNVNNLAHSRLLANLLKCDFGTQQPDY